MQKSEKRKKKKFWIKQTADSQKQLKQKTRRQVQRNKEVKSSYGTTGKVF